MKKYLPHIIWLVVVIVAFVGGMYYGKVTARPSFPGFGAGGLSSSTRGGFAGRGGAGGGFVMGSITGVNGQSITISEPNGNSAVVFYSSSTDVIEPQPAPMSALTAGTNVIVTGATNSDGSVTAQSIQIRSASTTPGFGAPRGAGGGQ
jgi:hypothetical protein